MLKETTNVFCRYSTASPTPATAASAFTAHRVDRAPGMDFGLLPPEINSAKMYWGPGSGPMLGAATAWESLVEKLHATATSFWSVIDGLSSDPWADPAAMLLAHAAAPYVTWLATTAECARQLAVHGRAAAAAYEAAYATMVPPTVVAANRSLLRSLAGMNDLSQNAAAMAVVEADYSEMWARNAAAMYRYARQSESACRVAPFTPPPHQLLALAAAAVRGASPPALVSHHLLIPPSGPANKRCSVGGNDGVAAGRGVTMRAWFAGSGAVRHTRQGGYVDAMASCDIGPAVRVGELSVPRTWVTTTGYAVLALRKADTRGSVM